MAQPLILGLVAGVLGDFCAFAVGLAQLLVPIHLTAEDDRAQDPRPFRVGVGGRCAGHIFGELQSAIETGPSEHVRGIQIGARGALGTLDRRRARPDHRCSDRRISVHGIDFGRHTVSPRHRALVCGTH